MEKIVNSIIRFILHVLCRIDDSQLQAVPDKGPLILVLNHVNFLDAPIIITHLRQCSITGLVKEETWDNPFLAFLFNIWEAIPVKRGTADFTAYGSALKALEAGKIFAIAPEGTRSEDGCLIQGQPGVIALAHRSKAPMLPVVYYGGEDFRKNIKRLKKTDIKIIVGKPFYLDINGNYPGKEERQRIIDEIMYQIANLLPEQYRGFYSDLEKATTEYIRY